MPKNIYKVNGHEVTQGEFNRRYKKATKLVKHDEWELVEETEYGKLYKCRVCDQITTNKKSKCVVSRHGPMGDVFSVELG